MKHRKLTPSAARSWREKDGIIYFSVTSDGTTGDDWIDHLERKDFYLDSSGKRLLRSSDFKPTKGMTTEVAVLRSALFEENDRITEKILAEGNKRKLLEPNAEVACLILQKFGGKGIKAMGLNWILVMHEPILNVNYPCLLTVGPSSPRAGLCWLRADPSTSLASCGGVTAGSRSLCRSLSVLCFKIPRGKFPLGITF